MQGYLKLPDQVDCAPTAPAGRPSPGYQGTEASSLRTEQTADHGQPRSRFSIESTRSCLYSDIVNI